MVHFSLIILTKRYFGKFSIIIRSNKAKMAQEALSSGWRIISEAHFLDNNYHHFFWFFFANNKNNWFPNPRHFLREKTSHKSYHQLIADFLGETFTGRRDPVQQSLIAKKYISSFFVVALCKQISCITVDILFLQKLFNCSTKWIELVKSCEIEKI